MNIDFFPRRLLNDLHTKALYPDSLATFITNFFTYEPFLLECYPEWGTRMLHRFVALPWEFSRTHSTSNTDRTVPQTIVSYPHLVPLGQLSPRPRYRGQPDSPTNTNPKRSRDPQVWLLPITPATACPPAMAISLPTSELSVDGSTLPIETVTVYRPSGAQVIRKLDVDLKVSAVNEIGSSSIRVLD